MRPVLSLGILAILAVASPANAQMMCGPGQQAQSSNNTVTSGMMCGSMGAAQDDPMSDKPAQPQQSGMMCPCCRNMAMMRGGKGGGMQHNMPGMEAPKQ